MPSLEIRRGPVPHGGSPFQVERYSLRDVGPQSRFTFRARERTVQAAGQALGFPLPTTACRSTGHANRAALWLGPDEWFLLGRPDQTAPLQAALAAALAGQPYALVDVGHAYSGFLVSGPNVASVLNGACPLNLSPSAFPVGACTRTLMSKVPVVLWHIAEDEFRLEVGRSYAFYLCALLKQCAEFAPATLM